MTAKYIKEIRVLKWIDAEVLSFICHKEKKIKGGYINIVGINRFETVLIFCPQCGEVLRLRNHQVMNAGNENLITINPSINAVECCGWHGWLKDGEFSTC